VGSARLEPEKEESTACGVDHAVVQQAVKLFVWFFALVAQHIPAGKKGFEEIRTSVRQGNGGQLCRNCNEEYLQTLPAGSVEYLGRSQGDQASIQSLSESAF
jgi:hypothetical protein